MGGLTCFPDLSLAGLSVEEAMRAFKDITCLLDGAEIEYVVAGGIALRAYEETRYTKDLDLWLTKKDAERALEVLSGAGYKTERSDERWLYKAFYKDVHIDLIFVMADTILFDEEALKRSRLGKIDGQEFRLIAPEDLLAIKVLVFSPTRGDWADAVRIIDRAILDWKYFLHRCKGQEAKLASFLLFLSSTRKCAGTWDRVPAEVKIPILALKTEAQLNPLSLES